MPITSVKITQKGQVTIPKEIRAKLNSSAVYFEIENEVVTIKPVRDAAGSLREYARNAKSSFSMKQIKEQAWEEAVHEKASQKSA
jgi:AbrB family looped-hinge helix DNA binding protein